MSATVNIRLGDNDEIEARCYVTLGRPPRLGACPDNDDPGDECEVEVEWVRVAGFDVEPKGKLIDVIHEAAIVAASGR